MRDLTLAIYRRAASYAETRGIIIADTKFEFGFVGDQLVLADEVLTPDSSRFWPRDSYQPGGPQPSFDKQYVRDYLESIHWNKQPPAPALPPEVIERTSEKYREAYRVLTGKTLMNWIDLVLILVLGASVLRGLGGRIRPRRRRIHRRRFWACSCGFWFYGSWSALRARLCDLARRWRT